MSTDPSLYEETFTITTVLNETYDRVSRILGHSVTSTSTSTQQEPSRTSLTLDINSELYPLHPGETIHMLIATTLNLDGTKDERERGWRDRPGEETLASMWDYVCYGKVYRTVDAGGGGDVKVYVSFGGLLMCLAGPYRKLSPLRQDYVYLLLKK